MDEIFTFRVSPVRIHPIPHTLLPGEVLRGFALAFVLLVDPILTLATEESPGLLNWLDIDPNRSHALASRGLYFGGWINSGIAVNTLSPPNVQNGTVTFNTQDGVPELNQFYLYLERQADFDSHAWKVGGRADFLYGTDAVFTQTYGSPFGTWDFYLAKGCNSQNEACSSRYYSAAVPQAYLSINAPVGRGLNLQIGHFYTPFGFEVVTAPGNFFYSHAYTMQYGEPFTHTGFLFHYEIDHNLQFRLGSTTGDASNGCTWRRQSSGEWVPNGPCLSGGGWDGDFNSGLGAWAFIGGAKFTSDDEKTLFSVKTTVGPASEQNRSAWGLASFIFQHTFAGGWHYVFQHDQGFADHILPDDRLKLINANWHGINQYLFYPLGEDLSLGLRAEWFQDPEGFRVCNPNGPTVTVCPNPETGVANAAGNGYFEVTAGLTWKPDGWLTFRPNIRWDKSTSIPAFGYDPVTQAGTAFTQVMLSMDVIAVF